MGAEDEFRKVAEDVRELARALRTEMKNAQREAKSAARQARDEIRNEFKAQRHGYRPPWQGSRPGYYSGWTQPPPPYSAAPPAEGSAPPMDPTVDPSAVDGQARPTSRTTYGARPRDRRHDYRAPVWAGARPAAPPAPPRPPKPARPKPPPVRHRHDGSTLISLLLVLMGLAWLFSETHVFNVSLEAVLAVCLAILGAGMVVTARTDWSLSRHSWPVWLGAGMLVVLLAAANSSRISSGLASMNFGPNNFTPTSWGAANGNVDNFAGPISIDLTQLPGASTPPFLTSDATLTVRDTFGPVTLTLPQNPAYHVRVIAHAIFGPTSLPSHRDRHGTQTEDFWPNGRPAAAGPTLTVDMQTWAGPVNVRTMALAPSLTDSQG